MITDLPPAYGTRQRALECCAIVLFALLTAWCLWRIAAAIDLPGLALVCAAALCGWLAADLFSGLVHWAFDSWGSLSTPLIGRAFILPFREHHADPAAMVRHDFVETNGASCLGCLPALAAAAVLPLGSGAWVFLVAWLLFTALGVLVTNQSHKWAHVNEAARPGLVRWAQRRRLLLPPAHHRRHHTPPFNSHYCTTNGWLNAPFNALLRVWR